MNNVSERFNYSNAQKTNKNFMYKDFRRSNCYNCDFSGSNFNFASFRGAHFKSCDFFDGIFESTEFIGTNLKKSKFKNAILSNVIFEGANLSGVDFRGAQFKNVIFLDTDLSKALNLNLNDPEIRIFEEMPTVEISDGLKDAIEKALTNEKIKKSRVLDTKEGNINPMSIMRLLEVFSDYELRKGLNLLAEKLDHDFCTLSYIVKAIRAYIREELI